MKKYISILLVVVLMLSVGCNKAQKNQTLTEAIQLNTQMPIDEFFEATVDYKDKSYNLNNKTDGFVSSFLSSLDEYIVFECEEEFEHTKEQVYISLYAYGKSVSFIVNENDKIEIYGEKAKALTYNCDGIYTEIQRTLSPAFEKASKHYKILYTEATHMYKYEIYGKNGKIIESGETGRYPHISLQGNDIVCMWIQSGTGLITRSSCFYDVSNGIKSPYFYGQTDSYGSFVSETGSDAVIIYDMFSGETVLKLDEFEEPLADYTESISSAYFTKNGKQLEVRYWTEINEEVKQIIDLSL